LLLPLAALLATAFPAQAQESVPSPRFGYGPPPPVAEPLSKSFSAVLLEDPFSTLNGKMDQKEAGADSKPAAKEGPAHIRDNAFLVEEAFNQEPGVVQHIFNWINYWDWLAKSRTRDFAWTYTMELPLGSQAHQFSFTTQFQTAYERLHAGPSVQDGDIGDTFLNYRYQLLADDDFLWCAPRFTLILPTGDERLGLGTGQLGYQFNLPISRYGEAFDFHFNIGFTYIPNVTPVLEAGRRAPGQDLRAFNLGGSAFWKPETYCHLFVEFLWLWNEELDDVGFRQGLHQVFANPGIRYAICQFDQVEWVVGVSAPIGLNGDAPDIGIFGYMSIEHAFLKENGG
jgi:hypothetical protein